jgi:glycosyltransferase involved in cell wall biosynthesis
MKVVLITLSGDPQKACDAINSRFPDAEIERVSRDLLDNGSPLERLRELRAKRPKVFAVMTESLEWLSGRQVLMLFGALAGASQSVIIDAHGRTLCDKRATLLLAAPFRIARAYFRGLLGSRRAKDILSRLESEAASVRQPHSHTDSNALRVAYLRATPGPGTQPGGAASHINGVVKHLTEIGTSVTFISNDEIAGLDMHRLNFHKVTPESDIMPRSASDIQNGMTFSESASSIISSYSPSFIYQRYARFSYAGVEAALRSGVPLFLEYNGSEVWIGRNWDGTSYLDLLERFERLNLSGASRIFVVSEVEKNNLIEAGISAEKIVVNPNGVDTDEFRPGIGGAEVRNELGITDKTVLVGFVGTFGPWHGVLNLADAIAATPKEANIHFMLVGDGSLASGVKKKLRKSEDLSRVTFTGVISHKRVPVMLDACDILVSPHVPLVDSSEFFGSPTKLFEYMAMGKAIVASRLGQIGDVLSHNQTALLVEPGNAGELSLAVQQLADDAKLRERLGRAARECAMSHHTWQSNAARILDEFRGL